MAATVETAVITAKSPSKSRRTLLVTACAVVAALVALIAVAMVATNRDSAAPTAPEQSVNLGPNTPGGSIYDGQVPDEAHPSSPLAPGGSVYNQQVPELGR